MPENWGNKMVPALELKMNTNSKALEPIMPPTERKNLPLQHESIYFISCYIPTKKL